MNVSPRQVRNPRELRALAHPIRVDLLEYLLSEGPLTATQAAGLIGESPASCSFHLRQLARYGFVEPAGGGRGRQHPWRLVGRGLTWSASDAPAGEETDLAVAVAGAALSSMLLERVAAAGTNWIAAAHAMPLPWTSLGEVTTGVRYLTADQLGALVDALNKTVESFFALDGSGDQRDHGVDARRVRLAVVAVPDPLNRWVGEAADSP